MFKRGGTTNTGIMDGFEDMNTEDRVKAKAGLSIEEQMAELSKQQSDILAGLDDKAKVPEYDPTFDQGLALAKAGFNLASAPGGQPIFQTIGQVAEGSLDDFSAIGQKKAEFAKEQRETDLSIQLAKLDALQDDKEILAKALDKDEFQRALDDIEGFEKIITDDDSTFAQKQSAFNSLNFVLDKFVGQDIDILDRQGAEGEVASEMAAIGKSKESDPIEYERRLQRKLRAKILPGYNFSSYYSSLEEAANKEGITFAEGGRVEKQQGGLSNEDAANLREQSRAGSMGLTFQELRARLPREVSDEVVRLIATSEEALLDFANLETQDDIALFNQKYQSDLQLPSQVA
jgi:hypothetical protein